MELDTDQTMKELLSSDEQGKPAVEHPGVVNDGLPDWRSFAL